MMRPEVYLLEWKQPLFLLFHRIIQPSTETHSAGIGMAEF